MENDPAEIPVPRSVQPLQYSGGDLVDLPLPRAAGMTLIAVGFGGLIGVVFGRPLGIPMARMISGSFGLAVAISTLPICVVETIAGLGLIRARRWGAKAAAVCMWISIGYAMAFVLWAIARSMLNAAAPLSAYNYLLICGIELGQTISWGAYPALLLIVLRSKSIQSVLTP